MAANMTEDELRLYFRSPEEFKADPFTVLKTIAGLVNDEKSESIGREMLFHAFESRDKFGRFSEVLNSMARATGLFPYANPKTLSLRDLLAYEFHRPENLDDSIVFHREQAEVYRRLLEGDSVILSAPTSFGKSRVVDAMIASGRYTNIVVVVPTLALIDETRRRLSTFSKQYKVVTHLSQTPAKEKNIFVLTAERVVAYKAFPKIDFFVIDEFYKIGAMQEDESRTVALNEAFYRLMKDRGQFYLLGPNIQNIPVGLEDAYRCLFYKTNFSTVAVDTIPALGTGKDIQRLLTVLKSLSEPTLIYCNSPKKVNAVARAMLEAGIGVDAPTLQDASSWISNNYHPDWIFGTALPRGIGIHHGRLPRSLAQFVVRAFNDERIRFLICTSTLIEGVNTKAKNVLIWDNKIANRPLDFFTFNNIRGRSGRMFQHFVGRVYLFDEPPQEQSHFVDFPLFTQEATVPETLLIQLDPSDLTDQSKDRIRKFTDQTILPVEVLRMNHSVDPQAQIKLAHYLETIVITDWPQLAWRDDPNYDQLKFACELIWKYLVVPKQKRGVTTGSQLAYKTWQLYQTTNTATRIRDELHSGTRGAMTPDEVVERVLQFERSWAGFELPRLLMALSSIQREILSSMGRPYGDYTAFAAKVESLFRTPVVAALDEYGIPVQVAEKLQPFLLSEDNLDIALESLKDLDMRNLNLSPFEEELVRDAQTAL